jgi:hypothetical protein
MQEASDANKAKAKVGVCAIARNEGRYVREWIAYHLALGFDAVIIYDNEDDPGTLTPVLEESGFPPGAVVVRHFPGVARQFAAYEDALATYAGEFESLAFIDVDEFIVLRKHADVKALLADRFRHEGALCLSWVFFGSAGLEHYDPRPITQRFTRRQPSIDDQPTHVKSIVKLACASHFPENPHLAHLTRGAALDCRGRPVESPSEHPGCEGVACIHHYWTKSAQEFREKIERGRATLGQRYRLGVDVAAEEECLSRFNEVEDSSAWDFFVSRVGERAPDEVQLLLRRHVREVNGDGAGVPAPRDEVSEDAVVCDAVL